jgi:hypothetical protein
LYDSRSRRWTLPLALGLSDGIFNALTLATGAVLRGADRVTVLLGLKVGCVAFISAIFSMFIAQYAETRARLSRSTRQLGLSKAGQLASTHLGRQAGVESAKGAVVASCSSLGGAITPLLVAASLPSMPWSGIAVRRSAPRRAWGWGWLPVWEEDLYGGRLALRQRGSRSPPLVHS